jgi:hypothetical protein
MPQQQMPQQQMAQQNDSNYEELSITDKIKNMVIGCKDILSVLVLVTIFELDVFKEPLSFKNSPFMYDVQNDKSKFASFVLKGFIIALIFGAIQHFSK